MSILFDLTYLYSQQVLNFCIKNEYYGYFQGNKPMNMMVSRWRKIQNKDAVLSFSYIISIVWNSFHIFTLILITEKIYFNLESDQFPSFVSSSNETIKPFSRMLFLPVFKVLLFFVVPLKSAIKRVENFDLDIHHKLFIYLRSMQIMFVFLKEIHHIPLSSP